MWSKYFQQEVDKIEGKNIEGSRVIVEFDNGKLIDLPICWIEPVNDDHDKLKSSEM